MHHHVCVSTFLAGKVLIFTFPLEGFHVEMPAAPRTNPVPEPREVGEPGYQVRRRHRQSL